MAVPDVLRKLLTAPGPSGYEQAAAAVFREAAAAFAEVTHDTVGSSVARVKGTADGPLLAVIGHIDEIGLIVSHIDDDGFLWFGGVGGWDPMILVGQRVEVATRGGVVPGVVGKKPIHLLRDEERKQVPELRNLHIDIGAKDGDEARSLVRVGDVAVIAGEPLEYPNGRLVSRALDNRLGCFVAFEAARLVAEAGGAPGDVARRRGHAGGDHLRGRAHDAPTRFAPTSRSSSTSRSPPTRPASRRRSRARHKFGTGPVIGRGSTLDPQVFELLHAAGEETGIPFTVQASARYTGTDADAVAHLARRHPDRRRLDPAALHALAGRDGRSSRTSTTARS